MKRTLFFLLLTLSLIALLPAEGDLLVRVTAAQANVRQSPDFGAAVVRQVTEGTVLKVLQTTGSWYKVSLPTAGTEPKATGYISKNVVEETSGTAGLASKTAKPVQTKAAKVVSQPAGKAKKMWVRVGYQAGFDEPSADYSGTFTLYHEDAILATSAKVKKGGFPVISVGYQVHPLIGLELSAAIGKRDIESTTTAHVPHPLRFDAMRTTTRHDTFSIDQMEICLGAVYTKSFGKLGVDVTAGPAVIRGKTDLVTGFSVVDTYPFTNPVVTFEKTSQSKTAFGFFVGASVDYYIGRSLAIDAGVRYISASVSFEPVSGQDMKLKLGGLQAGGGIKFRF